jgi:hypothetical protein
MKFLSILALLFVLQVSSAASGQPSPAASILRVNVTNQA